MARAVWKGTLGFGLVSIGIELHSAESPERLDLDLLDRRDMARIGYQKINKKTGDPVEASDIVRGYQVSRGRYVVLEDADLKAANPKSTQTIDIFGFVSAADVPIIYYAKPYFIKPTKGSEKAYVLFRDALEETERIALSQLVVHTRQYVAAVFPFDGILVTQLLRYHAELKTRKDIGLETLPTPGRALKAEERKMAKSLIESMETTWEPEKYRDEYRDDLLELVKRRSKKGEEEEVAEPAEAPKETKIIDLMAALKQSIEEGKRSAPKRRSGRARKSA